MTAPAPPKQFADDPLACAAWRAGFESASATVVWEPQFCATLMSLAACASSYCQATLRARRVYLKAADLDELAALRIVVRQLMADFLIIDAAQIHVAEMRADGLDRDIAALCGIAAPVAVH